MSDIEIRSLNGHKLIDETARQMIVNLPKGEPDWNANEGEEGYIKNRTHWDERTYTEFTMEISPYWEEYDINFTELKWGETYPIVWNGITYECQAYYITDYLEETSLPGEPWLNLGNLRLLLGDDEQHLYPENDVPFIFTVREDEGRMRVHILTVGNEEGIVTATFTVPTGQVYKINNDFLPEGAQIGKKGTVQASEIFGDTNFNKATNYAAHAEGSGTIASGRESHAEGRETEAKGEASHAEGYLTKASSFAQHVQGKYNIEDSNDTYLHIVGNGTGPDPSNAYTLDWSGNAWYSGDVYVGSTSGTNKDEGSKKLATCEYVDEEITSIGTLSSDPRESSDETPDLSSVPINADQLGGIAASEYAMKSDLEEIDANMLGGIEASEYAKKSDLKDIGSALYTNFADNSDFTRWVAQAGVVGTHGTETYGGDRWILTDGTITGTANTDGDGYSEITLNGTLVQVVPSPPAVATAFVEMVSGTATISYDASKGEIILISSGGVIKNVLLLDGEWEDKPEYVSKGYATELTECQRYFLTGVGVHTVGHGGTIDSKLFYMSIFTPTTMYRNPVCIIDRADNVVFGTTSGYAICGVSGVVGAEATINTVFVELNLATKAPQNYATGSTFGTSLTFVADLPRR